MSVVNVVRGFCDEPISRPGESYRVCVIECVRVQQ
jgi:hypothetical protein